MPTDEKQREDQDGALKGQEGKYELIEGSAGLRTPSIHKTCR